MFMKVNKIPEERIFERIYSDKNYRGIRVFFIFGLMKLRLRLFSGHYCSEFKS